jgi:hypothetical protein
MKRQMAVDDAIKDLDRRIARLNRQLLTISQVVSKLAYSTAIAYDPDDETRPLARHRGNKT